MTPDVLQLKRNDVKGALNARLHGMMTGTWESEDEHMLIMLQDDPKELLKALMEQSKLVKAIVLKALPRKSEEVASAKPAAPAGKASTKIAGSGGQVRYSYPGEKGGDKKPGAGGKAAKPPTASMKPDEPGNENAPPEEAPEQEHRSPAPDTDPIKHPGEQPPQDDPRATSSTDSGPQHTVNVNELVVALGTSRAVLQGIAKRFQDEQKMQGRVGFIKFMGVHAKEFASEHHLEGDYFGLVYDVLTGVVPEGQPSKDVAKQTKAKTEEAAAKAAAKAAAQPPGKPPVAKPPAS